MINTRSVGVSFATFVTLSCLFVSSLAASETVTRRWKKQPEEISSASATNTQQLPALEALALANPTNAKGWIDLGNLYYDSGQPQKAIEMYRRALELQPTNVDVLSDLGVMYRRVGLTDKALESFNAAITINATHWQSYFNKGVVLYFDTSDSTEEALECWDEILKVNAQFKIPDGTRLQDFVDKINSQKDT